jgi:hypothetical protein
MKYNGLILLALAVLLMGGCAEPRAQYQGRDPVLDLASTCATCGATIHDSYFAGSSFKAMGPGSH